MYTQRAALRQRRPDKGRVSAAPRVQEKPAALPLLSASYLGDTINAVVQMSVFQDLLSEVPMPRVIRVRQEFARPILSDPAMDLSRRLAEQRVMAGVAAGARIAVAVGSRGISNLALVVQQLVQELRDVGAEPFIVPAMGSHGGATASGQIAVLNHFGVTERSAGAPIRSSMETVRIGITSNGIPVHVDRLAHEADGIIVVNRIKPHVSFRGPYESGIMKMLAIGLGKQKGAEICHQLGFDRMSEVVLEIGREILARARIIAAVGLIENAYHETCRIVVLHPTEIEPMEPALLDDAWKLLPRFFFEQLDVLVIDEAGKNISGTGFDNNIVGRYTTDSAHGGPSISRIVVRDLTPETGGNANGIGIADVITRRVYDQFRFEDSYPNALTSTATRSVRIPMVMDTGGVTRMGDPEEALSAW